jgi:hypothetical protein
MNSRTLLGLAATCGSLLLTGCVTKIDSPDEAYSGTTVSYDKYAGRAKVTGKELYDFSLFEHQTKHLVTTLDGDGRIDATWIDVTEAVQGYVNLFVTAHDDHAQPLLVEAIERERAHKDEFSNEEIAVDLPPDYLLAHANSGIDVRLEGRHGTARTSISALYIQGYLRKLQEVQACVKMKTC